MTLKVIYGLGEFISPESRNVCISRILASTSFKLTLCSPRDPRVQMAQAAIHGSAGVPWQLHSPLCRLNPCFHRSFISAPRAAVPCRGGRCLTRASPGAALPAALAPAAPAEQFRALLPCANRSPRTHAPVFLQKQQPGTTEYLQCAFQPGDIPEPRGRHPCSGIALLEQVGPGAPLRSPPT